MNETQRQLYLAKTYRKLRCLVIDDLENFRMAIRQMVRTFGVEHIKIASNGEDAINKCSFENFDIVLCDYNLGDGKNGQQILEELRFRKILKHTSLFVLITAETSKDMVMGALEYTPDCYLTKPITKAVLQKRLDALIEQREVLKPINHEIDKENYTKAITLCREEIGKQSKYSSWCLRTLANLYYRNTNYIEAKKIYENVLKDREIGWARLGLGKLLLADRQFEQAVACFKRILEHNAHVVEAHDWLSEAYKQMGLLKDAQKELETAVKISPLAILRQEKLGDICIKNQDIEAAAVAYKATVKLANNSCYDTGIWR